MPLLVCELSCPTKSLSVWILREYKPVHHTTKSPKRGKKRQIVRIATLFGEMIIREVELLSQCCLTGSVRAFDDYDTTPPYTWAGLWKVSM